MRFHLTELEGLVMIEPQPQDDARGFLSRTYCEREFDAAGLGIRWVQQNHTLTKGAGSVRGLHYQREPYPEAKLVRCLSGRVLDVAVDIRPESGTFGKWAARELSGENRCALYIPTGFAHGFQCLTECCELLYLMSDFYSPEFAAGICWNDPVVGIAWPLPVEGLSDGDKELPTLAEIIP